MDFFQCNFRWSWLSVMDAASSFHLSSLTPDTNRLRIYMAAGSDPKIGERIWRTVGN